MSSLTCLTILTILTAVRNVRYVCLHFEPIPARSHARTRVRGIGGRAIPYLGRDPRSRIDSTVLWLRVRRLACIGRAASRERPQWPVALGARPLTRSWVAPCHGESLSILARQKHMNMLRTKIKRDANRMQLLTARRHLLALATHAASRGD
jgi:hypothetical protein